MPRRSRSGVGGLVYHVLNRATRRVRLFHTSADYLAFERILSQATTRAHVRLLAYCAMPNHWHMVVWPCGDGQLSKFMHWLTLTHTKRWHAAHRTAGTGPLYQGRFKSVPVQDEQHWLRVCRYVERNPLRANLVSRAEEWRWSSLWHRSKNSAVFPLDDGPIPQPNDWVENVNRPQTEAELGAIRQAIRRGAPFGEPSWSSRLVVELGLQSTLRARGRPRKDSRPL